MPRRKPEMLTVHRAADHLEGIVAARVVRGFEALRETVSIHDFALAIATGDVDRVMRMLPVAEIRRRLSPVETTLRDSYVKGGKLAAEEVGKL